MHWHSIAVGRIADCLGWILQSALLLFYEHFVSLSFLSFYVIDTSTAGKAGAPFPFVPFVLSIAARTLTAVPRPSTTSAQDTSHNVANRTMPS